tara:strand:- start:806 stop:1087 length:282 start_codon:yes stop_codon:yes gene_type:complete
MDFLDHLKDYMDVEKYYKKLNKLEDIDYKNIINYLNIQWTKILQEIDDEYYSSIKLKKIYKCDKISFNEKMNEFINMNYTMGIFFINSFIRYI